jgi:hypothetical protein
MVQPLSRRRRRRRHLRRELYVIRGAVEAARILGEALATDQLGPEHDHRSAPRAITSLLSLVSERLRTLQRAARRGGGGGEPRRLHVHRAAGWERLSPDERVLAICAMRQRAGGADRRSQHAA